MPAAEFMAAKDNKKRGEIETPSRWSNEITGILWITGGLLLLLCWLRLLLWSTGEYQTIEAVQNICLLLR